MSGYSAMANNVIKWASVGAFRSELTGLLVFGTVGALAGFVFKPFNNSNWGGYTLEDKSYTRI